MLMRESMSEAGVSEEMIRPFMNEKV